MQPSIRVLLLEDDLAFADLVQDLLTTETADCWEVTHVSRLQRALQFLKLQPFDAVLSDLHVPDAQGIETLIALRKANSSVPVVVLTGEEDSNGGVEAVRRGAQDYLNKQAVTLPLLERSLRYAIERIRNQVLLQQNEQHLAQLVKARTAQLQQEARRRKVLFDASLDGIAVLDQGGYIVEANPRFASALGYSLEAIVDLHMSTWVADASPQEINSFLESLFHDKTECMREVQHRRRDGSLYYAEISATFVDWDDTPLLLYMSRDVSERKQAEENLRTSEQKHRALVEALPDLVMRLDHQGTYLDFFPPKSFKLFRAVNLTRNKVTDGDLPPDLAHLRMHYIQQALETGELQLYEQTITINGQQREEEVRINPVGPDEVIAIVRDITDRKQAEVALAQSEATNRAIINAIPDLLIQMHRDGRYKCMMAGNAVQVKRPKEIPVDEVSLYELLPQDLADQRLYHTHQALASGELQIYEQSFVMGGDVRDEEVRIAPLNDQEVLVIIRDICDRKQAERKLHQLNQELEARIDQRTAALQASENRFRGIFEQSPLGIAITNLEGQIIRANPSLMLMLGYSKTELLQQSIQALLNFDNASSGCTFDPLLEGTLAAASSEHLVFTRQGSSVWVKVISACLFDGWGRPSDLVHLIDDVTAEREAKIALEEISSLQQAILNSTNYAIISTDLQGSVQTFNAGAERMLGYRSEEVVAKAKLTLFHMPAEIQAQAQTLATQTGQSFSSDFEVLVAPAKAGQVYEKEWTYLSNSGEQIPIILSVSALWDRENNLAGFLGIAKDISRQKQAEREAQQLRERLEFALTSSAAVIFTRETTGNFRATFIGENVKAITGYSAMDIMANPDLWMQLCHYEDLLHVLQQLSTAVEQGEASYEYRYRHRSGSYRWIREEVRLVTNGQGEPELVGYCVDVSRQKLAESALRQSEARYRAVVEDQTDLICRFREDGSITFANKVYCDYFQLDLDQFSGQNFWQHLSLQESPAVQVDSRFQSLNPEQPVVSFEHQVIGPNNQQYWQFWTNRGIFDARGQLVEYQAVGRDISERKQAEAKLYQINERLTLTNSELHRATRLKDEFLASMSHELRTPLNAILGMAEGLDSGVFGEINHHQRTALQTIDRSGRHLLALINDILDLSKVEAGKLELQKTWVSIRSLCEFSLVFIKQQAHKKQLQLLLELPPDLPPIEVDSRRIQQVMINLLTNAVKFTAEGGRIRLAVTAAAQPQPQLHLSVIDTGIGIAADNIPKLFQPFVQIDSRLNRRHSGTGLGLALVRRLVELHSGTVSLQSKVGEGSCFTVSLPYPSLSPDSLFPQPVKTTQLIAAEHFPPTDLSTALPVPQPGSQSFSDQQHLVLLAEDNEASAASMMGYLSSRGYRVVHARNGQEVIDLAAREPPDIILMDIQMPQVDGIEATRKIRTDPTLSQTPIIALTALAMSKDRDACLTAGVNEYITKPVRLKSLATSIHTLLHQSLNGR